MGWFEKSENIPIVPDLGNASEGKKRTEGSSVLSELPLFMSMTSYYLKVVKY
jgi:hypothetical protein